MRVTAILVMALGACNMAAGAEGGSTSSGQSEQRNYEVGGFDKVALAVPFDVTVNVGGATSVRAAGDPKLLERLDIQVEGRTLKIRKRGTWSWNGDVGRGVKIHVTTPALAAASIGGSGDMHVDKVSGAEFAASIGGSGNMEIGSIRADRAQFSIAGSGDIQVGTLRAGRSEFSIAGSGDIKAAGSAESSDISIVGSGNANLDQLEMRTAKISVVASGSVRGKATESADISVLGSGDVALSGSAKCRISKLGSGDISCGA